MPPLTTSPSRGYPDWQRVGNWDSDALWVFAPGSVATNQVSPLLNVSRWGYLAGTMGLSVGQCQVRISWWSDVAQTVLTGQRIFTLDSRILTAQVRLPNLGAFAQITLLPTVVATPFTPTVNLIGTNRFHPLEFISAQSLVWNVIAQAVGAAAVVDVFPANYYAGPALMWVSSPNATGNIVVIRIASNGSFVTVKRVALAAGDNNFPVILPPGAWFVEIQNNGAAAGNYDASIAQSSTGSS